MLARLFWTILGALGSQGCLMEQIRAPQAAPEWPSAELGIDEKRSLRKGAKSAFKEQVG